MMVRAASVKNFVREVVPDFLAGSVKV